MKNFLILSVGPVPSAKNSITEGGGLRAWGLANGLIQNGVKVTVAQPENFKIDNARPKDNLEVTHWSFDNVKELCEKHDSVYLLYSRGDLTRFICGKIDPRIPLVVDCYVPIYIEALAREIPKTKEYLNKNFGEISNWNLAFQRGDYFICANNAQYHFYNGLLAAFGRINPITFNHDLLELVPYGIHSQPLEPITQPVFRGKKTTKDDFVILWFGGLYPWFNMMPLLEAFKKLAEKYSSVKLAIVGGKKSLCDGKEISSAIQSS